MENKVIDNEQMQMLENIAKTPRTRKVVYQVECYTEAGVIYHFHNKMDGTTIALNGTFEKEFNPTTNKWDLISIQEPITQ